jgi:hypothetical protein
MFNLQSCGIAICWSAAVTQLHIKPARTVAATATVGRRPRTSKQVDLWLTGYPSCPSPTAFRNIGPAATMSRQAGGHWSPRPWVYCQACNRSGGEVGKRRSHATHFGVSRRKPNSSHDVASCSRRCACFAIEIYCRPLCRGASCVPVLAQHLLFAMAPGRWHKSLRDGEPLVSSHAVPFQPASRGLFFAFLARPALVTSSLPCKHAVVPGRASRKPRVCAACSGLRPGLQATYPRVQIYELSSYCL